ncbi:MAG TPA: FAD-binding protein [Anaerolineae bacterium]|nr:FAD-binding protein [Anaerolineae bacterium]
MEKRLVPTTLEELQSMVKENQQLLPVGGGTKPALSGAPNGATRLEMSSLSGLIEYDPGEYTFTAYAGTPVGDIVAALAEHGQYLPFDPPLVKQGATLGGVVAANTSGPGRYRYGGVRDFILGVHFIDGQGQLVRSGGKVVKNAAGFDLPKFMVGSAGRFGVLVDLSFKVFPEPRDYVTVKVHFPGLGPALAAIAKLFPSPLEMDVLDLEPLPDGQYTLVSRMGGLSSALPGRTQRLQAFFERETEATATEVIQDQAERDLWAGMNAFAWVDKGLNLVKVPLSPKRVPLLENVLSRSASARRYMAGGNVAWLAVSDLAELDRVLTALKLSGMLLFGSPDRPFIGVRPGLVLAQKVKQALDPERKFLAY